MQGIDSNNILSKKYIKDYKQGGYYIETRYKDDLNHLYDYHYMFYTGKGFNTMTCIIYDNRNNSVTDYSNTTYKPIE